MCEDSEQDGSHGCPWASKDGPLQDPPRSILEEDASPTEPPTSHPEEHGGSPSLSTLGFSQMGVQEGSPKHEDFEATEEVESVYIESEEWCVLHSATDEDEYVICPEYVTDLSDNEEEDEVNSTAEETKDPSPTTEMESTGQMHDSVSTSQEHDKVCSAVPSTEVTNEAGSEGQVHNANPHVGDSTPTCHVRDTVLSCRWGYSSESSLLVSMHIIFLLVVIASSPILFSDEARREQSLPISTPNLPLFLRLRWLFSQPLRGPLTMFGRACTYRTKVAMVAILLASRATLSSANASGPSSAPDSAVSTAIPTTMSPALVTDTHSLLPGICQPEESPLPDALMAHIAQTSLDTSAPKPELSQDTSIAIVYRFDFDTCKAPVPFIKDTIVSMLPEVSFSLPLPPLDTPRQHSPSHIAITSLALLVPTYESVHKSPVAAARTRINWGDHPSCPVPPPSRDDHTFIMTCNVSLHTDSQTKQLNGTGMQSLALNSSVAKKSVVMYTLSLLYWVLGYWYLLKYMYFLVFVSHLQPRPVGRKQSHWRKHGKKRSHGKGHQLTCTTESFTPTSFHFEKKLLHSLRCAFSVGSSAAVVKTLLCSAAKRMRSQRTLNVSQYFRKGEKVSTTEDARQEGITSSSCHSSSQQCMQDSTTCRSPHGTLDSMTHGDQQDMPECSYPQGNAAPASQPSTSNQSGNCQATQDDVMHGNQQDMEDSSNSQSKTTPENHSSTSGQSVESPTESVRDHNTPDHHHSVTSPPSEDSNHVETSPGETETSSDIIPCTDSNSPHTPHTEPASQPALLKTEQSPNHSSDSSTALTAPAARDEGEGESNLSSQDPTMDASLEQSQDDCPTTQDEGSSSSSQLDSQCFEERQSPSGIFCSAQDHADNSSAPSDVQADQNGNNITASQSVPVSTITSVMCQESQPEELSTSGSDNSADSVCSETHQRLPPAQWSSESTTTSSSSPSPPPASLSPSPSEPITQSPAHQEQSCHTESEHSELQNDTTHCNSSGLEEGTPTEDPLVDEAESSVEGKERTHSNYSFDNSTALTASVARDAKKPSPTAAYLLTRLTAMLTYLLSWKKKEQDDDYASMSGITGRERTGGEGENNHSRHLPVQDPTVDACLEQNQMERENCPTTQNEDGSPSSQQYSQCSVEKPSPSSTSQPVLNHTDHSDNPAPSGVQLSHNSSGEEKSLSSPIPTLMTGESPTEHEHSSDSSADSLSSETDQRPPLAHPPSELSTSLPPSSPPSPPQAPTLLPPSLSEPITQSPAHQEKMCHTEREPNKLQNDITHCDSSGMEEGTDTEDTLVDEAGSSVEGEDQAHSAVGDSEAAISESKEHARTKDTPVDEAESSVWGGGQTHPAVGDGEEEHTCTEDTLVEAAENSVEGEGRTHSAIGDSETASSEQEEHRCTKDTLVETAESSVEEEGPTHPATGGGEAAMPGSSGPTPESNVTQSRGYTVSVPSDSDQSRRHKLLRALSWIGTVVIAILSPWPTVLHWIKGWYYSHTTARGARDGGGRTETEEERDTRGFNSSSHQLVLEGTADGSLTSEQHHTEQDNHTSTQGGTEQDSRHFEQDHESSCSAEDGREHGTPHSGERQDNYHLKTEHRIPRNQVEKDDHQSGRDSMEHVTPHSGQNHDSCITAQDGTEDNTHHRQERQDSYQVETEQSTPQSQAMRDSHQPAEGNEPKQDNCQDSTDTSDSGDDQTEESDHHPAQDVSEEDSPQSEQKQDYLLVHNKTEHSTSWKDVEESNCQSTQSEREQDTHHSQVEHQGGTCCTQHPHMEEDTRQSTEGDRGRGTHCHQTEQQDDQSTQGEAGHVSPQPGQNEVDQENHQSRQGMMEHSSLPSQQSSCDGHPRKFGAVEDQVSQDNHPPPPCNSPSTPAPQTVCQSPPHPPQLDTSSPPSLCDQTDPSKVDSLSRGPGPGKGTPSQLIPGTSCQVNPAMYNPANPLVYINTSPGCESTESELVCGRPTEWTSIELQATCTCTGLQKQPHSSSTTAMNTSPLQPRNHLEEGTSCLVDTGAKGPYLQDTSSGHRYEKKQLSPSADRYTSLQNSGNREPKNELTSAEMKEPPTSEPVVNFNPIQDHGDEELVGSKEMGILDSSYLLQDKEDGDSELNREDEVGRINKKETQELEEDGGMEGWKAVGMVEAVKDGGAGGGEEGEQMDPHTTSAPMQVTYSDRHQGPLTTEKEKHQNLLADSMHKEQCKTRKRLASSGTHENASPSLGVEKDHLVTELAVSVQETPVTQSLTTPTNIHDDSVVTSEAVSMSQQTGLWSQIMEHTGQKKPKPSTLTMESGIGSKTNTASLFGNEGFPQHPTPALHLADCSTGQLQTEKEVQLQAAVQERKTTGHPLTGRLSAANSSSPPPLPRPGVIDGRDHVGYPGNQKVAASSPVHGSSNNEVAVEEKKAPSSSNIALAVELTISPLGTHSNVPCNMEVQSPVQKSATSGLLVGLSFYPHDPILKKLSHGSTLHILPFDGPIEAFKILMESSVPEELCSYIDQPPSLLPPLQLLPGPVHYSVPGLFFALAEDKQVLECLDEQGYQ